MPSKKSNKKQTANVSQTILDLIYQTFPDGLVEMSIDADDSYLAK